MNTNANVKVVRHFNRFYTKQIGVLQQGWLGSQFSLTETRVLYELAHREQLTATDIGKELGLDAGYLSRMLRSLEQRRVLRRTRSNADARCAHMSLTREGQAAFARLNEQTEEKVAAGLAKLGSGDQRRLVGAMHT
ncbi:MAG: MarR family winged helix-turn-helix transcriptional regulator, partial [Candidatus Acidiferrum sp.]